MKLKLLMLILILMPLGMIGQILCGEILTNMIEKSIRDYTSEYSSCPHYLNSSGLPMDFPYDSLGLIPINMANLINNPKQILMDMKQGAGIGVLEVQEKLVENKIIFSVTRSTVKMLKRRKFEIMRGEDISSTIFQFSCEDSLWHGKPVLSDL